MTLKGENEQEGGGKGRTGITLGEPFEGDVGSQVRISIVLGQQLPEVLVTGYTITQHDFQGVYGLLHDGIRH